MTATEYHQLLAEARLLPDGIHQKKLLEQLDRWGPQIRETARTGPSSRDWRESSDAFSSLAASSTGPLLSGQTKRLAQASITELTVPTPEPVVPKPPSEQQCVEQLAKGDAELSDILVSAHGWERVAITRKLIVMLPPGNERFFVLPVEREFVMGAFDEILATILFDHVPGQLRYVCERPCVVDRTGFAVERLKDADYWRTRDLTRGTLV